MQKTYGHSDRIHGNPKPLNFESIFAMEENSSVNDSRIPADHDMSLMWPLKYGWARKSSSDFSLYYTEIYDSPEYGELSLSRRCTGNDLAYRKSYLYMAPVPWRNFYEWICVGEKPIWSNEDFWIKNKIIWKNHMVRVCKADHNLLEYFPNIGKAVTGNFVRIKPVIYFS